MNRFTWSLLFWLAYSFVALGVNSVISERVKAGDTAFFPARIAIVIAWPVLIGIKLADSVIGEHPLSDVIFDPATIKLDED